MNPELLNISPKNSKRTNKKRVVLGIITIIVIGSIAASVVFILQTISPNSVTVTTSQPTDLPSTGIRADVDERNEIPKNQTATFGYFDVKINKVTRNYKPTDGRSPSQSGYVFLLLDITATNTSKDAHSLSDIELGVLSGQDVIYSSLSVLVEPVFKTGSIDAGKTVSGNLVFEVPPNKDVKLYYNTQIYNYETQKLEKIEYILAF